MTMPPPSLEAVGEVKDEEGIGVEPEHRAAIEADDADPGAELRPPLDERLPPLRRLEVEHDRAGQHDEVPLREHEVVDHRRRGQRQGKRRDQLAGGVDLVEPDDRPIHPIGEREHRPGLRMAPVMGAQLQRRVGAGAPLADGFQLHRHLVAGRRLVQRQQMSAMAHDVDAGAVLERPRFAVGADQSRVDRHGPHDAAIERAPGAPLRPQAARVDETVAVARPAVVQIDRVDHAVAVERIGVGQRLEQRIRPVAHVDAAQVLGDPPRDDGKVGDIQLRADRSEVAAEMGIVGYPAYLSRMATCVSFWPRQHGPSPRRRRPATLIRLSESVQPSLLLSRLPLGARRSLTAPRDTARARRGSRGCAPVRTDRVRQGRRHAARCRLVALPAEHGVEPDEASRAPPQRRKLGRELLRRPGIVAIAHDHHDRASVQHGSGVALVEGRQALADPRAARPAFRHQGETLDRMRGRALPAAPRRYGPAGCGTRRRQPRESCPGRRAESARRRWSRGSSSR